MRRHPLLPLLLLLAATPVARAQSVNFTVLRQLFPNTEGRLTYAPLAQGADGFFYGTASRGGASDQGTIFRLDANGGNFAVLYAFTGPPGDGARPEGGLVQAADGLLYGNTIAGGVNDRGLLYRLSTVGGLQALGSFNLGYPGASPTAELVQADDGNLYGTAEFGGISHNFGTVIRVGIPGGTLAEIAEFNGSPDAANPAGRLLATLPRTDGGPGTLLGATLAGGSSNLGALFAVNTSGAGPQVTFSFSGTFEGSLPRALTLGPDGTIYGLTRSGGALNYGSIFRFDPTGNFALLYRFNPSDGSGYDAVSELLLASDGNLYGTTQRGGTYDAGTLYRLAPGGGFATLYSFTGVAADGGYPQAALTQGSDGRLYGVAAGQQGQAASVFRLDLGLPRPRPTIRVLSINSGNVGDTVAVIGNNLVGATGVRFPSATTGTAVPVGPLTVVSAHYATFTVPAGAAAGSLTVLDADGQPGPASPTIFLVSAPPVAPPIPLTPPTVALDTTDPVATRGNTAQPGRFRLTRAGGSANTAGQTLTIRFKVQAASTARRDVDYQIANRGVVLPAGVNVVTLPANKFTTGLDIVPLPGGGGGTVNVKLATDPAGTYTLGAAAKGTVTIQ